MQRRDVLQAGRSTLVASLAVGLAGCSGGGGDGSGTDGDSDGGATADSTDEQPTQTPAPTDTPTPEGVWGEPIIESGLTDKFEFVSLEEKFVPDEFQVNAVVRNLGDATVDITEFDFWVDLYDEAGEEFDNSVQTSAPVDGAEVEPGNTVEVEITLVRNHGTKETVSKYTVELECSFRSESVYCEE